MYDIVHSAYILLDEHDPSQWYDIIHFEHNLLWLYFGIPQNVSYQLREDSLIINSRSFPKLADMGLWSNRFTNTFFITYSLNGIWGPN